jgi:hypothetical protein
VTRYRLQAPDNFVLGHVPGAVKVSLGDLDIRKSELDVVARRSRLFSARRLEDGMPECNAAGLAVEIAAWRGRSASVTRMPVKMRRDVPSG